MSTHKALFISEKQGAWKVGDAPTPTPGPDEVLVKVLATALNPVDWKIQRYAFFVSKYPAVVGSDSAGEIAEVGANVKTFKKGDKVVHQGSIGDDFVKATFQQYVLCPAEIVAKIPDNITVDQAATLPLGIGTAVVGLYDTEKGLGLTPPWIPEGKGKYKGLAIVVTGGSSSVGQYAVQFAKLSGFSTIITTCSLKHEEYIKALGATHVVNRGSTATAEIKKILSNGTAPYVYDAISDSETQATAVAVTPDNGTILLTLAKTEGLSWGNRKTVHTFGNVHFQRKIGVSLYAALHDLIASGDLKPNKVEVLPNGLAGIPDGLQRMEDNKISNLKLVGHPWD